MKRTAQSLMSRVPASGWVVLTVFCLLMAACSGSASMTAAAVEDVQTAQEWDVVHTSTGRLVSMERWLDELAQQDVVYLGEEHHNRFHVEAARKILEALLARARTPVVALEMFGWDGQAALDRYLTDPDWTRAEFLDQSRWKENWGGPFEDYELLVAFARDRRLSVQALNPPRQLVRLVAKRGLAEAKVDPGMIQWGMKEEPIVEDPAYRETILKQLRLCHGGGTDGDYQTMYEASLFRDEGMAKTVDATLRKFQIAAGSPTGPVFSYTGGGHIQYQLPVPNRVTRRRPDGVRQVTVYMTSFQPERRDEIAELVRDRVADYVWLTPVGAQGPPRRCR